MNSPHHSNLPVYVIGHKNPDTDAICSAIGNAAFLKSEGMSAATPARCGEIGSRTSWVLAQAKVPAPTLILDVRTTAGMLCQRVPVTVSTTDTFLTAYQLMEKNQIRAVPVVDAQNHICGILRYYDLLKLLMPSGMEGVAVRTVLASEQAIINTLRARVRTVKPLSQEEEDFLLVVGASSSETICKRLTGYKSTGQNRNIVVICGDRPDVQRFAVKYEARMLIVTSGFEVPEDLVALAAKSGTSIIEASQDTASVGKLFRCARSIQNSCESRFIAFSPETPLRDVRKIVANSPQILFPVVSSDNSLLGVFSKSDLIDPPRNQLVLVDHNEYSQAVDGIEEADIIEVLDHHRLGGDLVSRNPIRFLNEPVGSTSTLVARRFFHREKQPDRGVALCLCAGILSDTINLTSPTTTSVDRKMLAWLCQIAQLDPVRFTADFFAAGSLLKSSSSAREILNSDRKEFNELGWKLSISQIEEVGLEGLEQARPILEDDMAALMKEGNFDLVCLLVTDVSSNNSQIIALGHPQIVDRIEFQRLDQTLFDAPGVVSRKKQLFPAIAAAVHKAGTADANRF